MKTVQYLLPIVFIIFGLVLKYDRNPKWDSSRWMSTVLLILGTLTLLGRIVLDYK